MLPLQANVSPAQQTALQEASISTSNFLPSDDLRGLHSINSSIDFPAADWQPAGTRYKSHRSPSRMGREHKRLEKDSGISGTGRVLQLLPLTQREKTGIFLKKPWAPPLGQILDVWAYQNRPSRSDAQRHPRVLSLRQHL